MQVLNITGESIERLHAAGDCTGGFLTTTYSNLFTDPACGRSMTFARHAAKLLASK
jgi:hypothetical protein